jgi:hypothetical protein
LAGILCTALGCRLLQPQPDAAIARSLIAFYPQALACNPCSPYLPQSHHDVPWEEPKLVRKLIRNRWVARQWLARVYGWVRGRESNPVPGIMEFLRSIGQSGPHHPGPIDRLSDVR